jgi:hypothetical protein
MSLKMLQKAYGESTLSKTRVYEWYKAVRSRRDVMEDLSSSVQEKNVKIVLKELKSNSLRHIKSFVSLSNTTSCEGRQYNLCA